MKALAVGVDDAGRGSIIGPLVIAGVLHPEDRMDELRELGVRDSKKL
ncbi:MAG: ribonuclease HII, partial [Candidatus Hecatellaceae archaeon]